MISNFEDGEVSSCIDSFKMEIHALYVIGSINILIGFLGALSNLCLCIASLDLNVITNSIRRIYFLYFLIDFLVCGLSQVGFGALFFIPQSLHDCFIINLLSEAAFSSLILSANYKIIYNLDCYMYTVHSEDYENFWTMLKVGGCIFFVILPIMIFICFEIIWVNTEIIKFLGLLNISIIMILVMYFYVKAHLKVNEQYSYVNIAVQSAAKVLNRGLMITLMFVFTHLVNGLAHEILKNTTHPTSTIILKITLTFCYTSLFINSIIGGWRMKIFRDSFSRICYDLKKCLSCWCIK